MGISLERPKFWVEFSLGDEALLVVGIHSCRAFTLPCEWLSRGRRGWCLIRAEQGAPDHSVAWTAALWIWDTAPMVLAPLFQPLRPISYPLFAVSLVSPDWSLRGIHTATSMQIATHNNVQNHAMEERRHAVRLSFEMTSNFHTSDVTPCRHTHLVLVRRIKVSLS